MGDLISKSALIKIIKQEPTDGMFIHEIIEAINELPTVDAVPVVRCKDCIHFGNKIKHGSFLDVKQCDFHGTRHENSHCSDGEKVQE